LLNFKHLIPSQYCPIVAQIAECFIVSGWVKNVKFFSLFLSCFLAKRSLFVSKRAVFALILNKIYHNPIEFQYPATMYSWSWTWWCLKLSEIQCSLKKTTPNKSARPFTRKCDASLVSHALFFLPPHFRWGSLLV
jgi:hypothetical protein